jgi:hypothetical protein
MADGPERQVTAATGGATKGDDTGRHHLDGLVATAAEVVSQQPVGSNEHSTSAASMAPGSSATASASRWRISRRRAGQLVGDQWSCSSRRQVRPV